MRILHALPGPPRTLRRRLTMYYLALLATTLLIVGIGLYMALRTILLNGIRDDLSQVTLLLQRDFQAQNESLESYFRRPFLDPPRSAETFSDSPIIVQLFNHELKMVQTSQDQQISEPLLSQANGNAALGGEQLVSFKPAGTSRMLVLSSPLRFEGRIVGVVVVAQSLKTLDRALDTLVGVMILAGSGMIILTGLMVWGVTRRGLEPLHTIASTAEQIVGAEDLSVRIPDAGDRDELGRLVAIVNRLLQRLEMLFNAQRRLVADVSHELRTPLAAMRGNLEVIRRGAARDPELLQETLADMERETTRLTRLVNDLLLLAQSEAGVEIGRSPVELDTLVLEVYRELRPLASGVSLMIGAEDQAIVMGDRDRLKQALLNLAHNALRFTPNGGEVRLDLEREGSEVRLSVIDTGRGIPTEALPHIFERFYRVDGVRGRSLAGGGAGLGLAIVKWVAEAHGGRVEVTSEVGKGSAFTLVLPLAQQETPHPQPLSATRAERGDSAVLPLK